MSSTVKEMLATCPADLGDIDQAKLTRCIEECIACAQACTACADACLSEGMVATWPSASAPTWTAPTSAPPPPRSSPPHRLRRPHHGRDPHRLRRACKACADECARHADMHERCRICAEACRSCQQACDDLLGALG